MFDEILRSVKLPLGDLLQDGTTYRITSAEFRKIKTRYKSELKNFEKFLVLTYNQKVVGGVLFYGDADIQVTIFKKYRGKHLMSKICKNGILKSECYPEQKVTVSKNEITSFDDFLMKHHLLQCAELKISNLSEIYKYFNVFEPCDKLNGFQQYSEEDFIRTFS